MTDIQDEMVGKFRRAISDIKEPLAYDDSLLVEYIEDAIDKVYIDWQHGYEVDRASHTVEPDIPDAIQILFVMQAKLDLMESKPDISFRIDSIDIRRKSNDKKELSRKIRNAVNKLIAFESIGVVDTEFDDYADRLANWLYVENL